jgi:hypothetical protein
VPDGRSNTEHATDGSRTRGQLVVAAGFAMREGRRVCRAARSGGRRGASARARCAVRWLVSCFRGRRKPCRGRRASSRRRWRLPDPALKAWEAASSSAQSRMGDTGLQAQPRRACTETQQTRVFSLSLKHSRRGTRSSLPSRHTEHKRVTSVGHELQRVHASQQAVHPRSSRQAKGCRATARDSRRLQTPSTTHDFTASAHTTASPLCRTHARLALAGILSLSNTTAFLSLSLSLSNTTACSVPRPMRLHTPSPMPACPACPTRYLTRGAQRPRPSQKRTRPESPALRRSLAGPAAASLTAHCGPSCSKVAPLAPQDCSGPSVDRRPHGRPATRASRTHAPREAQHEVRPPEKPLLKDPKGL